MYKLKTGEYGNLIVKNQKKVFEIYIKTQLGTLLVYGKILKIWKYTIRFWLHWGSWIKDYKRFVKEEKITLKALQEKTEIIKKETKADIKAIKQAYNK